MGGAALRMVRVAGAVLVPMLAAACGCASGPLTMDLTVVGLLHDRAYHLAPDGQLVLTAGAGLARATDPRKAYEVRLDEPAMRRLKRAIVRSGFLLAGQPVRTALTGGPEVRLEVTLGLWHNTIYTRGHGLRSVAEIVAEMNRNLPEEFRLDYTAERKDSPADPMKLYQW